MAEKLLKGNRSRLPLYTLNRGLSPVIIKYARPVSRSRCSYPRPVRVVRGCGTDAHRVAHLAAIGFVVAEAWFGVVCPLTTLEHELRNSAGQTVYEMSFIGYWLNRLMFYTAPEWVFTLVYTLFAILVVTTFAFYSPNWKRRP